jgi:broad specificity phosphatase PhoE
VPDSARRPWGRIASVGTGADVLSQPEAHRLLLLRHGQTEWSKLGRHTGRTDLELTDTGREQARLATDSIAELKLEDPLVISSPRHRALVTAELAGLPVAETTELLAEWDYGDYEGITTTQIRERVPDWLVWTHGCPGGESVADVSTRADRAVDLAMGHLASRDVVFVGHGQFSRCVIARWMKLPVSDGIRISMVEASIAVCGFEHHERQLVALGLTGHPNPCLPA